MSNPSCKEKERCTACEVCCIFTEALVMKKVTAVVKHHHNHYDTSKQVNGLDSGFYQSRIIHSVILSKQCFQRVADTLQLPKIFSAFAVVISATSSKEKLFTSANFSATYLM